MFKWIDQSNIKCIIIDADSLNNEYVIHDYRAVLKEVNVVTISKINKKYFIYITLSQVINYIRNSFNISSSNIVIISDDYSILKESLKKHIGTITTKAADIDNIHYLADFKVYKVEEIDEILIGDFVGFGAEAIVEENTWNKVKTFSTTNIYFDNYITKVYFGGRYYPLRRKYFDDDVLSDTIRQYKNEYEDKINSYYDSVLYRISDFYDTSQLILTYVPLKPIQIKNHSFDRFNSLQLTRINSKGIHLSTDILKCVKDFEQKSSFNNREENVLNAYKLIGNVKDKTVMVLDDIYTSGSTTKEISRTLYAGGAKEVVFVVIAVNQKIENEYIAYKKAVCPLCGGELQLRKNSKDGSRFFGCSNFNNEKIHCKFSIDIKRGLSLIKTINELPLDNDEDLDIVY